jgi:phenylpyruvate tautomerase PptA (4-oxalocrotonate tautomerase family)
MPFVQISLGTQHSDETKAQISDSIHQALRDTFNIPEDDYFQVFRSVPAKDLKFPQSYMGISHTEDITYIEIIARGGRTPDQKKNLYCGCHDHPRRKYRGMLVIWKRHCPIYLIYG